MNEQTDDRLTAAARQLATEIRPQRDLWPGIERAITEPAPQRSRWTPMFAQAAAVLLLVGSLALGREHVDIHGGGEGFGPRRLARPSLSRDHGGGEDEQRNGTEDSIFHWRGSCDNESFCT